MDKFVKLKDGAIMPKLGQGTWFLGEDKRFEKDEILKKRSREVEVIDEKIQTLIDDMIETMYKYNGVGLSAVQVGVLKRVVVIDIDDGTGVKILINPKIVKTKGEQEVEEGCLSFPNQFGKIVRPEKIEVEALNEKGKKVKIEGEGLLAQALAHEIDHLDGVLFVDKIIPGTLEYITPDENKK